MNIKQLRKFNLKKPSLSLMSSLSMSSTPRFIELIVVIGHGIDSEDLDNYPLLSHIIIIPYLGFVIKVLC